MKNFLVAGCGKGIGLSIVQQLSTEHHVWALTRTATPELSNTNANIQLGDCTNADWLKTLNIPETLDGLVYCPGSINLKPFTRLQPADFLKDFEQNVLGAVSLIQHCIPNLKRGQNPGVVLFSSVAAQTGMTFHSSIAASKGAVESLVKSLAAEYAPSKIRFNTIAPSLVETALSDFIINSPEKKEAAAKRHPLQRIGNTAEIAAMAAFLLSDQSGWITGQTFHIDGGLSAIK